MQEKQTTVCECRRTRLAKAKTWGRDSYSEFSGQRRRCSCKATAVVGTTFLQIDRFRQTQMRCHQLRVIFWGSYVICTRVGFLQQSPGKYYREQRHVCTPKTVCHNQVSTVVPFVDNIQPTGHTDPHRCCRLFALILRDRVTTHYDTN